MSIKASEISDLIKKKIEEFQAAEEKLTGDRAAVRGQ